MTGDPVLISTIAIGLSLAFIGGLLARRVGLPTIVGYLAAGVLIGPFTPGFVADVEVAQELAELGVILLMFGVGIHFSLDDLLEVRHVAIPGALVQMTLATVLGTALGIALGWGLGGGLVLGLGLSIASTVVMVRTLTERGELQSLSGRIAIGWLIVQDLLTVAMLVLLPSIAPLLGGSVEAAAAEGGPAVSAAGDPGAALLEVGFTLAKVALFAVLMVVVGMRVVPWLLAVVARMGSRELFTLAVLAVALGIAYVSSEVFGVSFALGAFLAGVVVSESDMSHQAAADALPLRDAFAVLFFVSVGMLVDPAFLLANPLPILLAVGVILLVNPAVAFLVVVLRRYPARAATFIGASLAQMGEFSFIVATLGLTLGLLPPEGLQLLVAASIVTITLNPFVFGLAERLVRRMHADDRLGRALKRDTPHLERLGGSGGGRAGAAGATEGTEGPARSHAVVAGFGRVGRLICSALDRRDFPYVVITEDRREVERLRGEGKSALYGDAANRELLEQARVGSARVVIVAVPDPHVARLVVERSRVLNPRVQLVVRTHSEREATHLREAGPGVQSVHAELELAIQMTRFAMRRFGVSMAEAEAIAQGLRGRQ